MGANNIETLVVAGADRGLTVAGADRGLAVSSRYGAANPVFQNIDIPGFDLSGNPLTKSSISDCAAACKANTKCDWYDYRSTTHQCWLKQATAATGVYTQSTGFLRPNSNIPGFDLQKNLNNVASLDNCWNVCQANTKCLWVNYDPTSQQCFLKGGKASTGEQTQFMARSF